MTPEMKKITVHIRHSDYDVERKENVYVFTPEELLALRKKWAGDAWDGCWGKTAEGWNGEIQPFGFMNDVDKNNYTEDKSIYLNSLTID